MEIIIIGGGPAGMLSSIAAKKNPNNKVTIIEKMNSLGRKLLITGKGRCNITSSINMDDFFLNIPGNPRFLYSAFQNFNNQDIITLLKEEGVMVKKERGNRVFPVSDRSTDILNAFIKRLKKLEVEVKLNTKVEEIQTKRLKNLEIVTGVKLEDGSVLKADKVIVATGGMSYPNTGSTGDGYMFAKELGHSITNLKGSLVPLKSKDMKICKELQGLSLKNVTISLYDNKKNKDIYQDFGEMIFTHFGVSGPTILSSSAHLLRYKDVDLLLKEGNIDLLIDLKPALDEKRLDLRIRRDFENLKNKQFKNSLEGLLPKKLINVVIELSGIDPEKRVNEITKVERSNLVKVLKKFKIGIQDFGDIKDAIITKGGINIKEINPKTMESKLVKGLHFAGEIVDVDAYTGGFNLQIAYSTGYTAGLNCIK